MNDEPGSSGYWPLLAALPSLRAGAEPGAWRGGDGLPDGAIQRPWFDAAGWLAEWERAACATGLDEPFA